VTCWCAGRRRDRCHAKFFCFRNPTRRSANSTSPRRRPRDGYPSAALSRSNSAPVLLNCRSRFARLSWVLTKI